MLPSARLCGRSGCLGRRRSAQSTRLIFGSGEQATTRFKTSEPSRPGLLGESAPGGVGAYGDTGSPLLLFFFFFGELGLPGAALEPAMPNSLRLADASFSAFSARRMVTLLSVSSSMKPWLSGLIVSYLALEVLQKMGASFSVERETCALRTSLGEMPFLCLLAAGGIGQLLHFLGK